jgi:hypothetical protein
MFGWFLGLLRRPCFFFRRGARASVDTQAPGPSLEVAPDLPSLTGPYATRRLEWAAGKFTDAEVAALASMLFVETSWKHNRAEHGLEESGILNVAMNRAAKHGVDLAKVVEPPGAPVKWNGHPTYRDRFKQAKNNRRFGAAKRMVKSVLTGQTENPIGDRTHMLHLSQMVRCSGDCDMKVKPTRWRCVPDPSGVRRCVPVWAVSREQGGTADAPIMVGEALFS